MKPKRLVPFLLVFVILISSVALVFADDTIPYTYDANGNLLSDGVQCFNYNDANQLAAVRTCATNTLIAEYVYDHTGQRIIEKHYQNGALQETVYTIGKQAETVVAAGGARQDTTYYRANGEIVARQSADGSKTFYHQDHLGSTGALTDAGGQVVEETRYYPFGVVRTGGALGRYLYTGQESDAETGLYYYGARFYDPALARFVQADSMLPDPYSPQLLNRYSYVTNNPLVYSDPTGNWPSLPSIQQIKKGINSFVNGAKSAGAKAVKTVSAYTKLLCGACGTAPSVEESQYLNQNFINGIIGYGRFAEEHAAEIELAADIVDIVPIAGDVTSDFIRYGALQMSHEEAKVRLQYNTLWLIPNAATGGSLDMLGLIEAGSNASVNNDMFANGNLTHDQFTRRSSEVFGELFTDWLVGRQAKVAGKALGGAFGKAVEKTMGNFSPILVDRISSRLIDLSEQLGR